MRILKFYFILCFLGAHSQALMAQHNYLAAGETLEILRYTLSTQKNYVILNMGYASSTIKNPEVWQRSTKIIDEVHIVFTAYPKNKETWITNYDRLLNDRIKAVQELEPSLKDNKRVNWKFILQSSCQTEKEAKRMYHGVVLHYHSLTPVAQQSTSSLPSQRTKELLTIYNEIESVVYGLSPWQDSVVYKVFDRNDWGKMLIVNDWTGSMYGYGAQAVYWHKLNFERNAVKYFIFFNDGNEKPDRLKRVGNTGGIYYCKPDSIEYLLKVMKVVAKRGTGGDIPENNIEALLKGIRIFKGYDELVMIADNHAAVRDIALIERVSVPVRVILCGLEKNEPIHPHYLEIAQKTKGSLHTIEEDITDLGNLKEGQKISIAGNEYIVKRGKIVVRKKTG